MAALFKVTKFGFWSSLTVHCFSTRELAVGETVTGIGVQGSAWYVLDGRKRSRSPVILLDLPPMPDAPLGMAPGLMIQTLHPLNDEARAMYMQCWLLSEP